jgi:hypothetical protein
MRPASLAVCPGSFCGNRSPVRARTPCSVKGVNPFNPSRCAVASPTPGELRAGAATNSMQGVTPVAPFGRGASNPLVQVGSIVVRLIG